MSSPNQIKKKKREELEKILRIARNVAYSLGIILLIVFFNWAYFDIYKPEEKQYIKNAKYAYKIIQQESFKIYKDRGYIYKEIDDEYDSICQVLRDKYDSSANCEIKDTIGQDYSIKFKNGITLHGFEKRPYEFEGVLVKDIIIDTNGLKGENTIGMDRVPIRIYSSGRMGGKLSPVNCRVSDYRDFGIDYASICAGGADINFMDSKIPLSYNIFQIGGKKGQSKYVGKNVSFLRADCTAFGAELIGADEYCELKGFQWATACYHDYNCAIELAE